MTSAFSWQNSIRLCPASFCIPRPNLPVTPYFNLKRILGGKKNTGENLGDLEVFLVTLSLVMSFLIQHNKSRKSRDTWSNRQVWPWTKKWSRPKANRVLPRECTGHSKHPLPTAQVTTLHMDITRWSTPKSDWLYSLQPEKEELYTISKNKTGSWLWLRSWTSYCQIQT